MKYMKKHRLTTFKKIITMMMKFSYTIFNI